MRRGEKAIIAFIVLVVGGTMVKNLVGNMGAKETDRELPFYSTANAEEGHEALELMRVNNCKYCHSLWGTSGSFMQNVPAPRLDGIGAIRDEAWFYNYLSSPNPQSILPSRLKKEYQMPSFASVPEKDRRLMARYLASLKVKDWYLQDTKKAEFEKLTGKEYKP